MNHNQKGEQISNEVKCSLADPKIKCFGPERTQNDTVNWYDFCNLKSGVMKTNKLFCPILLNKFAYFVSNKS
jgi:hypothetical protein